MNIVVCRSAIVLFLLFGLMFSGEGLFAQTPAFLTAEGYGKWASGWPEYLTYNTITDNDKDGMDDAWELAKGLNSADASDRNKLVRSGYTCLEVYLNSLVGEDIALDFNVSEPKVHDFMVAKDGTGDFTTINEAINAVPEDGKRYSIFVKKGTYNEKVFIGNRWVSSKKIISLIGENVDSVIVVWDDHHGKTISYPGRTGTISSDGMTSATMTVTSPDFYMENITVKNPSTAAQAEALYQAGDRQVLKNCRILGNQDTHRTKKGNRFFYYQCTIEGGVDFIYAGGTCYFYQCNIVSNRGGYITAPEDITYKATLSNGKTLRYGFFFKDCDIMAKDGVASGSVYLGRPWGPECGSAFLNCRLGNHINAKGWTTMGAGNEKSAFFAEYKSMNAEGTVLADISNRIDWSQQLNTTDVNNLMLLSKIYSSVSSASFNPVPMVVAPAAPKSLVATGNSLLWTANDEATGYVIYADGSAIGFSKVNQYVDTLTYASTPKYSVRAVGAWGNLSLPNGETSTVTEASINAAINSVITAKKDLAANEPYMPVIRNGEVIFDQPTHCKVYNLMGQQVLAIENGFVLSLKELPGNSVYVIQASDTLRKQYVFKIKN